MTTTEFLQRELRRVELSMRRAAKKPNTPPEELRGLEEKRANLCEARAAVLEMQARPEAGKPLTLEQLRAMDKPTPVWMETDKKTIEGWGGYWCLCQRGHILTPGMVSMYADKMDGAMFYAYPPAHIDREKWEPCEHCKPHENALDRWGPHQFPIDDGAIYYYDVDDGWEGEEINLCPWCGRPLTDEAWAELERRVCGG